MKSKVNENINLCEILKGHEGETFYCSLIGKNVTINTVTNNAITICNVNELITLHHNGGYRKEGESQLYPSKDQRDWNKWDKENNYRIPKTWSEMKNCNVEVWQHISQMDYGPIEPIVKSALALLKIHQLIEIGYGGLITNPNSYQSIVLWDYKENKPYVETFQCVFRCGNLIRIKPEYVEEFLSFPENINLLKDYFMI